MTKLLIVRHAESVYNVQNRIQGHRDSGLTPRGFLQARLLAQRIQGFSIDHIYSSDLGRAALTAREIAPQDGICFDPLLREIHLGDWEGLTPEEVNRRFDDGYERWLKQPSSIAIPNGEEIGAFRRRIVERVHAISQAHEGQTVLLVTHGGAITALVTHWLKADFDHLLIHLEIENTSLTTVEHAAGRARLKCINDASHLTSVIASDRRERSNLWKRFVISNERSE